MREIYKKIELESELQRLISEGKTKEEAVSIAIERNGLDNANYLIEAYLMPIDEITKEIEKYDSSKPKMDELAFVKELCIRYNVDRKALIERIQNVRRINRVKEMQTPERLESLKMRRDMLQKDKDNLSDKTMDKEEKCMFYFGLGVVTVVSGLLFYPALPILVGLIPVTYAVGVPTLRNGLMMKKEYQLVNKLVDLSEEIEYLDTKLNESGENLAAEVDKQQFDVLAVPESRNNAFVVTNEEAKKLLNQKPDEIVVEEISERAREFRTNNIEGPTLVKRDKKRRK